MRALFLAVCLVILTLVDTTVRAELRGEEVCLVVNELKAFPVHKLERVAIGDPAIADITVLSEREIMLIAKETGDTSLIVWDETGQRSFNIIVIGTDLEKAARKIRGLFVSSDIHGVKVEVEGESIYVTAEVLTELEFNKIKDILTPFANVVNLVEIKGRQPLAPLHTKHQDGLAHYSQMIEDIITNAVIYPVEAKEASLEGVVKVGLHLSSDGSLTEARIAESSGFNALDGAALDVVEKASPYPAFPPEIKQRELSLTVPIVFKSYVDPALP